MELEYFLNLLIQDMKQKHKRQELIQQKTSLILIMRQEYKQYFISQITFNLDKINLIKIFQEIFTIPN